MVGIEQEAPLLGVTLLSFYNTTWLSITWHDLEDIAIICISALFKSILLPFWAAMTYIPVVFTEILRSTHFVQEPLAELQFKEDKISNEKGFYYWGQLFGSCKSSLTFKFNLTTFISLAEQIDFLSV